jgi:diadenosine tetraphosphatase ApaH/serine/threonine PP2A family protein phosphatase
MKSQRIYAVGDIHGCFEKLASLMEKIDIDWDRDQMVFLGDYIDRGPESYEVVDYLVTLKRAHPGIVFLKGNHEEMLEAYLAGNNRVEYLMNGGQQTLESYLKHRRGVQDAPVPDAHLDFFRSLVLFYETADYIFVHAGLKKGVPLNQQDPRYLLWARERFLRARTDFGKRVVFGHTPFPQPLVDPHKIGIDTGAVYGNRLTCVRLPDETFFTI